MRMRIYLTEEKEAAEKMKKLGLPTTTFGKNQGKWNEPYSASFGRLSVVIIANKDVPGRINALGAARRYYGRVGSLKLVELPRREGRRVRSVLDWLAAGGTRSELEELCDKAEEWRPSAKDNMAHLINIADLKTESVEWLWRPYLAKAKLTLLEGDPGVGKSWVSLAIAAAVSQGRGLPGQEESKPAPALLASAEDGYGDTIRPRLQTMGARIENIHAIGGPLSFDEEGLRILGKFIEGVHPALIVIDPLVAYFGTAVDLNRARDTRKTLSELAHMCEKHSASILAVRHLAKGGTSRAIYRGMGSIDITAACRSVLLAGFAAENPQKRALVHIKSNLAPAGSSMGYEISDKGFQWTGESGLTAEQILSKGQSGENKTVVDEAMEFLKEELGDGAVEVKQVFGDARAAGIASERTLRRAKDKLRVKARRESWQGEPGSGRWLWELPR